jgi:broad specificity phosphatase PhoE
MARVLLLRHGQSTWNAESRWQGWADAPLSDEGLRQAAEMAARLASSDLRFTRIVSSDLSRSIDTAAVIAKALELGEVGVEPALRERDVGDWSGRTTEEIDIIWPGAIKAWRSGRLDRPPGGEHEPAFRARVVRAVERLAAEPGEAVLAITHGGVIRALQRHLGHEPVSTQNLAGRWFDLAPDNRLRAGDLEGLPEVPTETITTAL